MTAIEDVSRTVSDFLKNILHIEEDRIKVIKTMKDNGGWEAEAEVYEESSFIRALGLPSRVMDKNIYVVDLDNRLEIQSYGKKSSKVE